MLAMEKNLSRLIEMAKAIPVSAADREEQRRSFAYGNTAFENERITRELIDRAADEARSRDR
jgi:hypothetical protein